MHSDYIVMEQRAEAAEANAKKWRSRAGIQCARREVAEATIRQQDELILSYQETIRRQTEKLAELEKQEPVACKKRLVNHRSGQEHHWTYHGEVADASQGDVFHVEVVPLFARAAPAVSLAELVPDEKSTDVDYAYYPLTKARHEGWNACRAAILRNIEEVK